jgi:hypothetical protein
VTWQECLSLMELLELKETGASRHAEHVRDCPRCRTLLSNLPTLSADEITPPESEELTVGVSRPTADAIEVMPGTIWIADDGEGLGFRELLAVVARSRRDSRLVLVVPISEEVEQATDLDLPLDAETLGYPAQLAVWNHGWIYDDQLYSPIGSLDKRLREEMTDLYRWLVAGGERPALRAIGGPPIVSPTDHRNLRRDEERERLQSLWRRVSRDQEPTDELDETRLVASPPPSFGSLVAAALESEEWDEVTLAERASIERADLKRVVGDDLDLTWASDARVVVALTKTLDLHLDIIEAPLRFSLARSRGGEPVAGEQFRAAARSAPGVSDEQVQRDLHTAAIDDSDEARARQIDRYWQRVVELHDDFS